jgi:hypothetical protein
MLAWLPPYRVELELWGTTFGDLAIEAGGKFLVSERFKAAFEQSKLTGIEAYDPVEIVRVRRHNRNAPKTPPHVYHRVTIARSRAIVDQVASGIEWQEPTICPECREGTGIKRWQRVIFEPGTWSGEDIFSARGLPAAYFTSERFKDFCEEHGMTNVVLIPAEEYAHDSYPWEKR